MSSYNWSLDVSSNFLTLHIVNVLGVYLKSKNSVILQLGFRPFSHFHTLHIVGVLAFYLPQKISVFLQLRFSPLFSRSFARYCGFSCRYLKSKNSILFSHFHNLHIVSVLAVYIQPKNSVFLQLEFSPFFSHSFTSSLMNVLQSKLHRNNNQDMDISFIDYLKIYLNYLTFYAKTIYQIYYQNWIYLEKVLEKSKLPIQ